MSLKHNILANYASQIYVMAVGIAMVPLYIRYMGAEAYGLVGFFAMLQAWFALLDMGLTPTMARESARYNGGASSALSYRRLARTLEGIFLAVALVGGLLLFFSAGTIATRWLSASQLPVAAMTASLQLIAMIVALRWMCGLYRGVITGAERLVWLSGFNSVIATGRFVLVLPVIMFVDSSPTAFFSFQLAVALVEIIGLAWKAYRLLPPVPNGAHVVWEWAPLKPLLKFSMSIAFTSSAWVLVTQTDKLVLSNILPLGDYGYFTVAVLVASGVMLLTGPVSSALMPRLTRLQAEGKHEELIAVYRQATQFVAAVAIPATLMLVVFAREVLWAWTGDAKLVEKAAPVLSLYAAGYGLLAVGAFPYYLQYAKGNLSLHLAGSSLFVLVLTPLVIWAATNQGATGAGWVWLLVNALYLCCWTPLVHRRFAPGLHAGWLFFDVARPALLPTVAVLMAAQLISLSSSRLILAFQLVVVGLVLLSLTYLMTNKWDGLNIRGRDEC